MNRYVDGVWVNNPPTGAAGGDLSGTYPDPTVAQLQGRAVGNVAPADTEVLTWNQALARWEPGSGAEALFPTMDANDLIVLPLTETAGDYVNVGASGGNFTADVGVIRSGASRFPGGAIFTDLLTARISGGDAIEPALGEPITLWAWVRWFGTNAAGSAQIVFGKPAFPAPWADPYWSAALAIGATGNVIAFTSHGAGPPDNPQTTTDTRYSLGIGADHLIGLTHDGATVRVWLDGQQIASAAAVYAIVWAAGLTPWVTGSVWSPTGDQLNGGVDRVGFCNVARAAAWWEEAYQRGISTYR